MALGKNIALYRTAAGLSLSALASMAGTSAQTIHKLEKTDAKRSEYAEAIARVFGLLGSEWLTHIEVQNVEQASHIMELSRKRHTLSTLAADDSDTVQLLHVGTSLLADDESHSAMDSLEARQRNFLEVFVNRIRPPAPFEFNTTPATQDELRNAFNVAPAAPGTRRIPVLSYVQAGAMTECGAVDMAAVYDDYITTDLGLSEQAFALEIKGDSMVAPPGSGEESFHEGDRIIVDCTVTPLPGDFVVARNGDHEATFKKYRPRGMDEQGREVFELVPLNPDYPTMRSDRQPVQIIGVMVEHRRYRKRR